MLIMKEDQECDNCDFKLVRPYAQFMFASVEKCQKCGRIQRGEEYKIEHMGLPRSVRDIIEDDE